MNHERYLARLGLEPAHVQNRTLETLERLQQAHVTTVPFETLSITGNPFGDRDGEGVSLALPDLYEKIVERRRGGFCYELNGLFGWLLTELGFDVDRLAAMVITDGEARPPANHLTHLVSLDQRYIIDVGLGIPVLRHPLPLDGTTHADSTGVVWRITESDRPDADHVSQFKKPTTDGWTDRYIFRDVPREMSYFEATCDYLQTAPESPFTGDPVVTIATDSGHKKLSPTALTHLAHGNADERSLAEEEWYDVLEREFGVRYPFPTYQ